MGGNGKSGAGGRRFVSYRVAGSGALGNDRRVTGWNEETLRKAASWKAFKEGRALLDGGGVIGAKSGQSGFQGSVRGGKRPFRVSVTVKSATNIEARCSCPENQASGMICGHAVAVGLAALAGGGKARSAAPAPTPAREAPSGALAWQILLPPNWREALLRGKLSATLAISREAPVSPADERLGAWLGSLGVAPKPVLPLNLDGPRVAGFLEAVSDHPQLAAGRDQVAISIRSGLRIPLAGASRAGQAVRLVPEAETGVWTPIGGAFWNIGADSISRAGEGITPVEIAADLTRLAAGNPADIPLAAFFARLGVWQEWVALPADCWVESLHFVPAAAEFELSLDGSPQAIEARLLVRYGESPPVAPGLGVVGCLPRFSADRCEVRDLAAEEDAARLLARAGFEALDPASGKWTLKGESGILDFLSSTLPKLRKHWSVSSGERFSRVQKKIAIVSPQIEITDSGEDWLSFDLKFQTVDGIGVSAAEVHRLLRSGKTSGRVAGDRHLIIGPEISELIDPLFGDLELHQENGRFVASARSGEIIREIRDNLSNKQKKRELCHFEEVIFPPSFTASLRPYQGQGASWLLDRLKRFGGALLADDMGLGKTIQTIACIECLLDRAADDSRVVLVLATTSLLGNWRAEFGKFAPGRKVRILHGSGRDKEREKVAAGEVVITSYGTLARDLAWHLKREYRAVVLDEASLVRNPDTDHAKAVAKLRSAHRIALTGTPVENGVRDLWSIFRFIQPGWLGTREGFRDRYEAPLAAGGGRAAVMERLRLKVSPFMLRRSKEQVAPELPSKIVIDEFCDLGPDQSSVYRELLVEGRKRVESVADSGNKGAARMRMLTALLRLRQTCCDLALLGNDRLNQLPVARRSSKLERLLELLGEAISGSHKILVFSQFQKQLLEIEKCVSERGWGCLRLDGQTRNRQQLVDIFQNSEGPPVFLISLKAGGYGLNLTAADIVIHFDPWWNPAAEAQATDRAHRIGQTRPVTVYRLLTRGTVEEKVVRLQARKKELAGAIDESGAGDAVGWSDADLDAVLRG